MLVTDTYQRGSCPVVRFSFNHEYSHYSNDVADVEIQVDGGPWQVIGRFTWDTLEHEEFNVSQYLDADSTFRFRFRYRAYWDWHWKIDDVRIQDGIR